MYIIDHKDTFRVVKFGYSKISFTIIGRALIKIKFKDCHLFTILALPKIV